jgi:hypothetical protein
MEDSEAKTMATANAEDDKEAEGARRKSKGGGEKGIQRLLFEWWLGIDGEWD